MVSMGDGIEKERGRVMTVLTSPLAAIAVEVERVLRKRMTIAAAQKWLLVGNEAFGGQSPIQMIKASRGEEVLYEAKRITES